MPELTRIVFYSLFLFATGTALAANPFTEWKERLFGARPTPVQVEEAPKDGVVLLGVDRPQHLLVGSDADQREFPKGKSRYREIELQREFAHVALRIQVIAERNSSGRGNTMFKPMLYLLDDDGSIRDSKPVEPLYLDIRPFKPTRLLACIPLEKVRRLALATTPEAVGKSYESKARDKVSAPTKGGFYYSTDPVNVKLPYAETGELVIELTQEGKKGGGC
jgi:hypothetical protein